MTPDKLQQAGNRIVLMGDRNEVSTFPVWKNAQATGYRALDKSTMVQMNTTTDQRQ